MKRKLFSALSCLIIVFVFLTGCNESPKRVYEYEKGYFMFSYEENPEGVHGYIRGHIKVEVYQDWVEVTRMNLSEEEKAQNLSGHWVVPKARAVYFGQELKN